MGVMLLIRLSTACYILCHLITPGDAFADGPPFSTCMTMFPKHHVDLTWQTSGPCPYKIKLSTLTYKPLQNVTITLEADDGRPLMGIQISAHRKSVNTEEFMGTFLSYSPEDKLKVFSCMGGRRNQVGHKNNVNVDKMILVWQAPENNVGNIIFKATFVQNFTTFWAWETQELRTHDQDSVIYPEDIVETPTFDMDGIDFSECGLDKGCFYYPRFCSGSDCVAALTYKQAGDSFIFEMIAKSPGYVTMGLSKDKVMGDDNTITCTARGKIATVQNGINPHYYNERVLARNLTNLSVKQTKNHVMCRFTRPRVLGVLRVTPMTDPPQTRMMTFDLDESWYLMMSWGHLPYGTDVMGKHTELPVVSDSMIDFRGYQVHKGSTLSVEYQAHGSLMVIAWILLTGLVTVIARYYKDMFQGKMLLGTKVWFQAHRAIAIGVLLFTAVSFIIIFVKVEGLSEKGGADHAKVGIAVGVAVLLQVFGGLVRPGADSRFRPWFTWGHRFLGQATHLVAAVNLILAFNMSYTPKSMKRYGTITVAVWIAVQVIWEIVFECWSCRKTSLQGKGTISDPKGLSIQEEKSLPPTRTDQLLIALYIVTLIAFSVATLCGIFVF